MPLTNWGDDFDDDEPSPIQEQMSKIGKVGGGTTKELYGEEHYKTIGVKGGSTTKERYGQAYYREIGRLSALMRKQRKAELDAAKEEFKIQRCKTSKSLGKHSNPAQKSKNISGRANTRVQE